MIRAEIGSLDVFVEDGSDFGPEVFVLVEESEEFGFFCESSKGGEAHGRQALH